jgi:cob(I)alamin adenosyltransferase
MKIYTKKGDRGMTSLFGGAKVEKNSLRIQAYGTVDELNSLLGVVLTHPVSGRGQQILNELQSQLFVLGADLATLQSKSSKIDRIQPGDIEKLETWIDELEEDLAPLTSFILPGGAPAGATLHLARTVCRRAERHTVALKQNDPISSEVIIYLNRLSDLLFVMARYENMSAGAEETPWQPRKK